MKKGLIICNYPFPEGLAASNRILSYCKGLKENSIHMEVLTMVPRASNKKNGYKREEIVRDVKVLYSNSYLSDGNKIYKLIFSLRFTKFKVLFKVLKKYYNNEFNYVLISFDSISLFWSILPFLILFKIQFGFISDEYPPSIRKLKNNINFLEWITYKIFHRFFSFRIVMSKALLEYYNEFSIKPSLILNSIVDDSLFNLSTSDRIKIEGFKLVYIGNAELAKDNLDNIIQAIAILKNNNVFVQFEIYGKPTLNDKLFLEKLIIDKKLCSEVQLKGLIKFSRVPIILQSSDLLVSSQPNSFRAKGGFPTKLGEYLLSGKPVLFTDVGEISEYLIDGVNGFLVPADSPSLYAEKILFIKNNINSSKLIGENGRNYILNNFTSEKATVGLAKFITKYIK